MKSDIFLEKARLGPRNKVLVEHDEKRHLPGIKRRFEAYTHVDLAHVVMLVEHDILDTQRGGRLLDALLEIQELGAEDFPWVAESGSCLVQFEGFITEYCGEDIAGRLQTGRSRNDQEAAVERLYFRDLLLELFALLSNLERQIIERSIRHADLIMPGYTHLQHAQPWTFGHYLMREAFIFERDLQRMQALYARTNLSSLGGAAQVGTSWPLDRERTAALLGHEGLVVNANDAGEFARDHIEEAIAVLSIMMSNLGRFATDLYVWSSWEFSLLEIDDGLAGTSSIMPQKKNPHALERIKSLAGQSAGWLPAVMSCQRGVLSTDLDMVYGEDIVSNATDACRDALELMTECVRTLILHESTMRERADVYWSTASHVADEIVRRFDFPFRVAHHVVGAFVKASIEAGEPVSKASSTRLDEAALAIVGRSLEIGDAELRKMLNAESFIQSRVTIGSANPNEVVRQADQVASDLAAHQQWLVERCARIDAALTDLHKQARHLSVS